MLNIYAPNPERQEAAESFIHDARYYLDPTLPALMCGDFNMVEHLKVDRQGGNPRSIHLYGKESLEHNKKENCRVDIWREKHPTKKQFTWHCRYDNKLSLDFRGTKRVYSPLSWSDHTNVYNKFLPTATNKTGEGYMENESFPHK